MRKPNYAALSATAATRQKKAKQAAAKAVRLKAKFVAAHEKGMAALERGDYGAVGEAIAEESRLIEAQRASLDESRKSTAAFAREITETLRVNTSRVKKAKKQ